MKEIICTKIEMNGRMYLGKAMLLPMVTREREGRSLNKGVELIVIAPNEAALDHAKRLLQGSEYEPLELDKVRNVVVSEAANDR